MSFVAAVTQPGWISALRTHGFSGEVNFWRPGRQRISPVHFGNPMLFVQKGRNPRPVPGFGIIDRYEMLSIRDAWVRWGTRNGVASIDEFVDSLSRVAEETSTNGGGFTNRIEGVDTLIGCVILRDTFMFPEDRVPALDQVLPDFPRNVVSYKSYPAGLPDLIAASALQSGALPNRTSGRLPQLDPAERDAVEAHAMRTCDTLFQGWEVFDVSTPDLALKHVGPRYPGYDVLVRHVFKELHIEVKGTKLESPVITITDNELQTAASDPSARLLVVSAIQTYQTEGTWHAVGGTPVLYKWRNRDALQAIVGGSRVGNIHALALKAPEWSLDVQSSDLLGADMVQM